MKKLIFSLFFVLPAVFVSAQTSQGNKIVGGSIAIDFNNNKEDVDGTVTDISSGNSFQFNPTFGYFVMDGLAVGAEIGFTTTKTEDDNDGDEFKSNSFTFGPFVKYYHESGAFGMGTFGFGSAKTKFTDGQDNSTNENKFGLFNWRLGVGYAAFLNDHVSVEPMLSYGSSRFKDKDAPVDFIDIYNSFTISVGLNIFLD